MQKLALLGFGTVGQGLAEILLAKQDLLKAETGWEGKIVAISDVMKGSIYDPDGLDIEKALQIVKKTGTLDDYPDNERLIRDLDSFETIEQTNADTIVEVTFTDVKTGQPAIEHCKTAFASGKHVVMSNKGPVALAYKELSELAKQNGVRWGFEGTVMSGTPALRMPLTALAGNEIKEITGILNGTTNYMLLRMEEGLSYEEALKEAQELGYAEADPTSDVEGFDARYKIVILANTVMNTVLKVDDVSCDGITQITPYDIKKAKTLGKRWKLIARVRKEDGVVKASVQPEMIDETHPLAQVQGVLNAVSFNCDLAGTITLSGPGAGRLETGYSLLIDLLNIYRNHL
ncbi:homoserine dehydrogenase [Alkalihalobacterium elongatum]|uniref:homoserine dehydrogenase n=1 Tax=Alkalihalobacterium elongatum TaxID=2675466 RepID=UPI001C1FEBD0|nr:homoserine dehydrogenase [Alkalihalobacterium elongatum]